MRVERLTCNVVTLYQGGLYHLCYKEFNDVRLVFTPESMDSSAATFSTALQSRRYLLPLTKRPAVPTETLPEEVKWRHGRRSRSRLRASCESNRFNDRDLNTSAASITRT